VGHCPPHLVSEDLKVLALGLAPEDQVQAIVWIAAQRGQGGTNVGGLGVIHPPDAVLGVDGAVAVLEAVKGAQCRGHGCRRRTEGSSRKCGSQGIGDVVNPAQAHSG
jgi:hypothetical protein